MINEKYSMLIKYKTRRTIIVLSPNSANLIKILTQFVYSINIRYFSPSSPVFCTAKYRGGVRRTEGLKRHHINQFISRISLSLCVPVRNIGGVPAGRGG